MHRKILIHAGFAYLCLFITYLAPLLENGKLVFTIQQISGILFIGFTWAFLAAIVYYESDIIESAQRTV